MSNKLVLTRTVWLLSLVSLCTDMASEMLYPIMPLFLKSIGFGVVSIGILEGVAEATAGLSKGYFGKWSDTLGRRAPFVQLGYTLSALSKPLLALWAAPLWVFFARTTDRLGKGIRTGARDAMLAKEATAATKARIFGFHRGFDTLGAAIGPLLALLFLWRYPGAYQTLFFLAIFPGLLAIGLTLRLKDAPALVADSKSSPSFFSFLQYIPKSSKSYRRLLWGLLGFALINSSDLFLLLMLKQSGLSDEMLIGIYIFYNLVYALVAYPAGSLADRWGLRPIFLTGLILFAITYGGMALADGTCQFLFLFFIYGLYAACTEGVAKAWISRLAPLEETGTAIGTYEGLRSLAALLASALAGVVWHWGSPVMLFAITAGAALLITLYFGRWVKA